MRESFLRAERRITGLATALACVMLALSASLGMWQIVTRFVIERPAEWTEVLIRFTLIWMVFLGIPMAFRIGAMVSVDVLYRWSRPGMKRVLDWVVCLAALALVEGESDPKNTSVSSHVQIYQDFVSTEILQLLLCSIG